MPKKAEQLTPAQRKLRACIKRMLRQAREK